MQVNPDFYNDSKFEKYGLSLKIAKQVGDTIGVNWDEVDLGEFCQGIKEEMEHGTLYTDSHVAKPGATQVHDDSFEAAGRIALAHLHEMPQYYTLLEEMEEEGEGYWDSHDRREWVAAQRRTHQAAWDAAA